MPSHVPRLLPTRLAPEAELLVYAARTDDEALDQLREALGADVDWPTLINLARRNAVGPLAYRTLSEHCESLVPDDVLAELRSEAEQTATHCLGYGRELGTVLDALDDAGVDAIPYRGAVLANDAYGDLSLRQFSDLDVLVRRDDVLRARDALDGVGYEPERLDDSSVPRSPSQERTFSRFCRDYPLYNPDRETQVELHWRVLDLRFPTAVDLDSVWDDRDHTTIAGREIPVFAPSDRLFAMCIHATRHHWKRLRWVCDVAEFCRRYEVDWTAALERARSENAERLFLLGPALAHDLFGTSLSGEVHRRIQEDSRIHGLRSTALETMFGDGSLDQFDVQVFQARALERNRDRARSLLTWAFKPRGYEIERFDLPRPLLPAYFAYRPLRLVGLSLGITDPPDGDHGR